MPLRARFGCFFGVIGIAILLVLGLPLWQKLQTRPQDIPPVWLWGVAGGALIAWMGVRLYIAGRQRGSDERPPSIARLIYNRFRSRGAKGRDQDG